MYINNRLFVLKYSRPERFGIVDRSRAHSTATAFNDDPVVFAAPRISSKTDGRLLIFPSRSFFGFIL